MKEEEKTVKRIFIFLLMLVFLCTGALAETAEGLPGQDSPAMITRQNEDGSVSVLGTESEPAPICYSDFLNRFKAAVTNFFEVDADGALLISPAYFSDGHWVRVIYLDYNVIMLVHTRGEAESAQVEQVRINIGDAGEEGTDELLASLLLCAAPALSDMSGMGQSVLYMTVFNGIPFGMEEPYWTENGWEIRFEASEYDNSSCHDCVIRYTGDLDPVADAPVASYEGLPDEIPGISGEVTHEEWLNRFNGYLAIFGFSPAEETGREERDGCLYTAYSFADTAMAVVVSFPSAPDQVGCVLVMDVDTNKAWGGTLAAFFAVNDIRDVDTQYFLSLLVGLSGNWDEICELTPYAVLNGNVLQATVQDGVPMGHIFGAE